MTRDIFAVLEFGSLWPKPFHFMERRKYLWILTPFYRVQEELGAQEQQLQT